MVPTLKVPNEGFKYQGFINAFIKDERREVQYEDCIYVLFRPENLDRFREFLDSEYERTKDLIDEYDYEEGFVVLVYKLNPKLKKDYELIKQGKYSKTSKTFQNSFSKTVKVLLNGVMIDQKSLQIRIFEKTEDLKEYWEEKLNVTFDDEYEVWDGWDEQKEVLNLDKIKEHVQPTVSE